jgi:carbon monoxide dehydrogenase subunit G
MRKRLLGPCQADLLLSLNEDRMPESQIEFEVEAPIDAVWSILTNPKMHTHCIPGLLACEVTGPNTTLWIMEFRIGPLIKKVEMHSTTVKEDPPNYGKWVGEAKGIQMSGEVELRETASSGTLIFYKLKLVPKSLFLLSMKPYIKERLEHDVRLYAENIKYQVEKNI